MNEIALHQTNHSKVWEDIESLEGQHFLGGIGQDEIFWKVVEEVCKDEPTALIKLEKESYDQGDLYVIVNDIPTSFLKRFIKMWPADFWDDWSRLNDIIVANNVERKKNL